ncbi:MAG: hypothetical protein EOO20_06615 [Chryseobacterium sp.]|nr:MAG: hypothetical protein EOO20_06615 [Chryseobacterium sp.]
MQLKNGILFNVFKLIIEAIKYLSLVELFKYISIEVWGKGSQPRKNIASRFAVDVFIIIKWSVIIVGLDQQWNNLYFTTIVWYLIIMNLHTYFYYHVWHKNTMNMDGFLIDRVRRRFLFLLLSIGFSNLAFAYLYEFPYRHGFELAKVGMVNSWDFIFFSFATSITAGYESVKVIGSLGQRIVLLQLVISFIFFTIILAKSIPSTDSRV